MLSTKLDLLMKKLDDKAGEKREVMNVYDSHMTCEECGDTGHSGNHCPEMLEDARHQQQQQLQPSSTKSRLESTEA
jgi:uncharacterized protein with PIN domain